MRVPTRPATMYLRSRLYALPLLVLVAVWLPGANQGWYRTDTHLYAAIGEQAWADALAQHSLRPLWDLRAGAEPYFNKPPVPFIVHGAVTHLLGLSVWTVRLPCLLAAIGIALATVHAVRRLAGWRVALMTGLVLATTAPFFRFTRAISLDLWQELFIAIGVAAVVAMLGRGRLWPRVVLAGVALGLALLCKPFVALAAPVLLGVWLAWIGKRHLLRWVGLATLVAVAVAAPWHVAMARAHPEFVGMYLGKQVVDRALHGPESGQGSEPVWYYANEIVRGYWPWLVTLALAVVHMVRTRAGVRWGDRRLLRLALLWSGVWLVALSCFGGKAPRYLLIVWPLLSAVSAWWMVRTSGAGSARTVGRIMATWLGPAAVAGAVVVAAIGVRVHAPRNRAWDALTELLAHEGRPLVTTPEAHAIAANLVMLGRPWPPVERDASRVPAGGLVMVDAHQATPPALAGASLVLESEDFRVYRAGEARGPGQ